MPCCDEIAVKEERYNEIHLTLAITIFLEQIMSDKENPTTEEKGDNPSAKPKNLAVKPRKKFVPKNSS